MKKIMFSDIFGLTQDVLDGRKTMTRRIIIKDIPLGSWEETEAKAPFKVGEIVAIAQSYASIVDELEDPKNFYCMEHWESASPKRAHYCGFLHHPGMTNKMFVSADEMPHQIRFNNHKVERLQDISDEDCIKEGVVEVVHKLPTEAPQYVTLYYPCRYLKECADKIGWGMTYNTPQEAFAVLIDKVSGKGTWESNPFVFAYSFELVK